LEIAPFFTVAKIETVFPPAVKGIDRGNEKDRAAKVRCSRKQPRDEWLIPHSPQHSQNDETLHEKHFGKT
jgi:hypothetical protein